MVTTTMPSPTTPRPPPQRPNTAKTTDATPTKQREARHQALAGALLMVAFAVSGITNKSLRACVAALTGTGHNTGQASYDLRRLRLKGLIERQPHTNTYTITPQGARFAVFYTKLHDKLFMPLTAADHPPTPPPVRDALRTIDQHIDQRIAHARLNPA